VFVDPTNPLNLYAVVDTTQTEPKGTFIPVATLQMSINGGASWSTVPIIEFAGPGPRPFVQSFAFLLDPSNPDRLLVGGNGLGNPTCKNRWTRARPGAGRA